MPGTTRPATRHAATSVRIVPPALWDYFISRLIQPLVALFSPFTIQLEPGYVAPTTASSTAFPTSSSLVLMSDASALKSFWNACANLNVFCPVLDVVSLPAVRTWFAASTASSAFFHRSVLVLIWHDRKSTRLNSSHTVISYAVFCLKK